MTPERPGRWSCHLAECITFPELHRGCLSFGNQVILAWNETIDLCVIQAWPHFSIVPEIRYICPFRMRSDSILFGLVRSCYSTCHTLPLYWWTCFHNVFLTRLWRPGTSNVHRITLIMFQIDQMTDRNADVAHLITNSAKYLWKCWLSIPDPIEYIYIYKDR